MNEVKFISVKQKDGYVTKLTYLPSTDNPRASILILHGMAEHQKRYHIFAEYLSKQGYDIYYYDHRGHGVDKMLNELGFFASERGYHLVIQDAINISNYINKNSRSDKFILFGHSMGSLIARNIIQHYDKYTGVILSGTTHPSRFLTKSGLIISSIIKKVKGAKHVSPFLNNLLFGGKKYTKLSSRTSFDWLTRNNALVGAYVHDPYCGFICTTSFYKDLIRLTSNATRKKLIRQTRRDLPILIISGEDDPVSDYGKEIKKFIHVLKALGFTNITSKLYQHCRHELLNELNQQEVFTDIYQWIVKYT